MHLLFRIRLSSKGEVRIHRTSPNLLASTTWGYVIVPTVNRNLQPSVLHPWPQGHDAGEHCGHPHRGKDELSKEVIPCKGLSLQG